VHQQCYLKATSIAKKQHSSIAVEILGKTSLKSKKYEFILSLRVSICKKNFKSLIQPGVYDLEKIEE
jgi:hypothetical protein